MGLSHFASIWGFTSLELHPNLTGLFLQRLILAIYIKLRPALLENILRESVELGVHSGVVVYVRQGGIYEYIWGHPVTRPLGMILPLSCGACGRLDPWLIPTLGISALSTSISCTKCPNTLPCSIPALCRVTARSQDASGEWFIRCLDRPGTTKLLKWSYKNGVLTGDCGLQGGSN